MMGAAMGATSLALELAAEIDRMTFDRNGFVETRVGFALELYLLKGETVETRLALCSMLREYHALFPDQLSHFLKVDANRLTKVEGEEYIDYYEDKAKSLTSSEPMDTMVFGYPGKRVIDEPTPLSISFSAVGPDPLRPLGRSYICAYFPAAFVAERGYGVLLDMTKRWAAMVETLHGGVGYSLLFEHGIFSGGNAADITILPALKRFPGLDFSDPAHFKVESDLGDGLSIKSINWLTVLGDSLVEKLGGTVMLREQLGSTCPVYQFRGGIVIQAGEEPQLGDVNRGLVLDDYRRVAQALRPVRFEAYRRGLFPLPAPLDPIEETQGWARRFD